MTNAENPYAPPHNESSHRFTEVDSFEICCGGILCRDNNLTLPKICLVTGRTTRLIPVKLQLKKRTYLGNVVHLLLMALTLCTSACFALLDLEQSRLWPNTGIPYWLNLGGWLPVVFGGLWLLSSTASRGFTVTASISFKVRNWASVMWITAMGTVGCLVPNRTWEEPISSWRTLAWIAAGFTILHLADARILRRGTILKASEAPSGLTTVTGFSVPFLKAIAEHNNAQQSLQHHVHSSP